MTKFVTNLEGKSRENEGQKGNLDKKLIVFFVKFRMMKKRHELFVFLGYLILTILLAVHFVLDITGRL